MHRFLFAALFAALPMNAIPAADDAKKLQQEAFDAIKAGKF